MLWLTGADAKNAAERWFYDDRGCELFEDITKLEEYYPTRVETTILRKHSGEMAAFAERARRSSNTVPAPASRPRFLSAQCVHRACMCPSTSPETFWIKPSRRFRWRFPNLPSKPIVADFNPHLFALAQLGCRSAPAWHFFPGSTIGNLDSGEVATFLQRMRRHVGAGGKAIIGVDMKKDLSVLLRAYDDPQGVTAEFDLNLLARINRELDGDFTLDNFAHSARWNATESAVEMHLVSRRAQAFRYPVIGSTSMPVKPFTPKARASTT